MGSVLSDATLGYKTGCKILLNTPHPPPPPTTLQTVVSRFGFLFLVGVCVCRLVAFLKLPFIS